MPGMATDAVFLKRLQEKKQAFSSVRMSARRFNTSASEAKQLTPWQRKVAHAVPAIPIANVFTKMKSANMFAVEEKARNKNGVLESPNAVKIPVAML